MIRPEIKGFSEDIIKAFLERGIFETQSQVIDAALMLLMENKINEESFNWGKETAIDDHMIDIQLNSIAASTEDRNSVA